MPRPLGQRPVVCHRDIALGKPGAVELREVELGVPRLEWLRHQPLPDRPGILRPRILNEEVAEYLPRAFHGIVGTRAGGRGEQCGLVGRDIVVDAGAVLDDERGVEDQSLEPVGYFLGDPADDRAAAAMTEENDVPQIPFPDEIRHGPDVVVMRDTRPACPAPVPRVGRRIDGMTEFTKAPRGWFPRPSAVPRSVHKHKGLIHRFSASHLAHRPAVLSKLFGPNGLWFPAALSLSVPRVTGVRPCGGGTGPCSAARRRPGCRRTRPARATGAGRPAGAAAGRGWSR